MLMLPTADRPRPTAASPTVDPAATTCPARPLSAPSTRRAALRPTAFASLSPTLPADPSAQARQACENVAVLLQEAGGDLSHAVKLTIYITDPAYREPVYAVIAESFGPRAPARTGLILARLATPELLVQHAHPPLLSNAPATRPGLAATNLSTSRLIDDIAAAARNDCRVVRSAVGEANVVDAMTTHACVFGGEGNGGVVDRRGVHGRDRLAACRLTRCPLAP